jgi:hypothetical protein
MPPFILPRSRFLVFSSALASPQVKQKNYRFWKRTKVGSAAHCVTCHPGAASGDHPERRIRIPG